MNFIPKTIFEQNRAEFMVFQCVFKYNTQKCNEEFDEALKRSIGTPMKRKDIEDLHNRIRHKWGIK